MVIAALVSAAALIGVAGTAAGQVQLPPLTTTTTAPGQTTTTLSPLAPLTTTSTTTTTTAPPVQGPTTTQSPTAPPSDADSPPEDAPPPGGEPLQGGSDGEVPELDEAGGFPDHLRAQMDSVDRTPASSTRPLVDILRPLVDEHGLTEEQAYEIGFGQFPVQGLANYTHDWWFPRFGPGWRLHEGTDIFAPVGTPVRAPLDGVVRLAENRLGGTSAWVVADDGSYVYLTHLSGYRAGLSTDMRVAAGEVVGYVGNTGNASTTPPHLHIEFHPGGGPAVDPKPILDGLLGEAVRNASALVAAYDAGKPRVLRDLGLTRGAATSAIDVRSTVLWASTMSPSAAVELAVGDAIEAARNLRVR